MAKNQDMLWTVLGPGKGKYKLLCRCACGTVAEVSKYAIEKGTSKACNKGHTRAQGNTTHGLSGTSEHVCWHAMKRRCLDPKNKKYKYYGGKTPPVTICERWLDAGRGFENFLEDMGKKPDDGKKYSIERKDSSKPYEPGNCEWATRRQQSRTRSDNRNFSHPNKEGVVVTKCLKDWEEYLGFGRGVLAYRIDKKKMEFADAVAATVRVYAKRKGGAA